MLTLQENQRSAVYYHQLRFYHEQQFPVVASMSDHENHINWVLSSMTSAFMVTNFSH